MDKTFSESWYRVANQRICLRPGVNVRRQNFRGERWMVLENPFSNQFLIPRPGGCDERPEVRLRGSRWNRGDPRFEASAQSSSSTENRTSRSSLATS